MTDPVISTVKLGLQRAALFLGLWLGTGTTCWLTMLFKGFDAELVNVVPWTLLAYDREASFLVNAVFRGCYVLSLLAVAVVYLSIALWWSGRVQAVHHRGPRLAEASR